MENGDRTVGNGGRTVENRGRTGRERGSDLRVGLEGRIGI